MKILIADDDVSLVESLKTWLEEEKYHVDTAVNGKMALQFLNLYQYDLLILDWKMPILTGIDVCKRYRQDGGTAYVIMLTGQTSQEEKVTGLDTGADDYITKPFSSNELTARIRALFRRRAATVAEIKQKCDLTLDKVSRLVSYDNKTARLVPFESLILDCLLQNPKQIFSKERLVEKITEKMEQASPESIPATITRLKHKLESLGAKDKIRSVPGGYVYEP